MSTDPQHPERKAAPSAFDRARTVVAPEVESVFSPRALTPRKRRMILAYVEKGTYSAAATASGMAAATVKKLIETDPAVRKAIGEMVDRAAAVTGITLERVLEEYGRLAFSDIGELVDLLRAAGEDSDVALEKLADLPAEITATISHVKITRKLETSKDGQEFVGGTMDIKLHDKKAALSDLGRMLSVFNDKLTIDDTSGFGDRLRRAVEKLEGLSDE